MTQGKPERPDFYDRHYSRFGDDLAVRIRLEIYGEDLGQTGWRSAAEQEEIGRLLRLGPEIHLLDVGCGSGGPSLAFAERTSCRVTGLDIEAAAIAQASAQAAARGLESHVSFELVDGGARLPFADASFGAIVCVDAINHLPDRFATLRDWARLLRPDGRLLFTDPTVVTGAVAKAELDRRASLGFFLFVPRGLDEEAIAAAGLRLLLSEDRTAAVADIAGRWHAARARHEAELVPVEGRRWFDDRQDFLEVTADLAASGRLSRFLHLAERPSDDGPFGPLLLPALGAS